MKKTLRQEIKEDMIEMVINQGELNKILLDYMMEVEKRMYLHLFKPIFFKLNLIMFCITLLTLMFGVIVFN